MVRDLDDPHNEIRTVLRGRLRLTKNLPENKMLRHLLTAGDLVEYTAGSSPGRLHEPSIEAILKRKNFLLRASPFEYHGLGANLDRACVLISLSSPPPRFGFLDRFLSACFHGSVSPVIIFSKKDLLDRETDEVREDVQERIEIYKNLNIPVYILDLLHDEQGNAEYDRMFEEMSHGVTLLAGNSGTGKSTLLNRLLEKNIQKTGEISESSGKGKHTTTNSSLFLHRNGEAMIIDTPGVKEWGLNHMTRNDLIASFPELEPYMSRCRFRNCDHSDGVEGCAVQEAIELSLDEESDVYAIHPLRLQSLYSMIDSLSAPDRIRTGDYIKPTGRMRKKEF